MADDAIPLFGDLLDAYDGAERISLYLYTRGGDTLAAWSLVNLLREFTDSLEVIVPGKCHSAGTLVCLGADQILMSKQATLGPIDPSINGPLNPGLPGRGPESRLPVSVEDVAGYISLAQEEADVRDPAGLAQIFLKLAEEVHPIALGGVKRARNQIEDLARKLLSLHMDPDQDQDTIDKIVRVLCREAGSHDYMIYRREARQ
ncbi:MAG: serine protease, partial [Proteobacteria bacterium SW_6_67_9]